MTCSPILFVMLYSQFHITLSPSDHDKVQYLHLWRSDLPLNRTEMTTLSPPAGVPKCGGGVRQQSGKRDPLGAPGRDEGGAGEVEGGRAHVCPRAEHGRRAVPLPGFAASECRPAHVHGCGCGLPGRDKVAGGGHEYSALHVVVLDKRMLLAQVPHLLEGTITTLKSLEFGVLGESKRLVPPCSKALSNLPREVASPTCGTQKSRKGEIQ